MSKICLSALKPGVRAVVCGFNESAEQAIGLARRMMEMGMTCGSEIEIAHEAPFGGAIAVRCRGTLIAVRKSDAAIVEVRPLS